MKKYTHITKQERIEIYHYLRSGKSIRLIAQLLWRSCSSISREVRRNNIDWESYCALKAQRWYEWKRSESNHRANKILYDQIMQNTIYVMLKQKKRSPDGIAWRMKKEIGRSISTQTIYTFIYERKHEWRKLLKYKRGYKKTWKWSGRWWLQWIRSIHERPVAIMNRKSYGHWEVDTIHGKDHQWGLVTIVERKSRYCELMNTNNRTQQEVGNCIIKLLWGHRKQKLLTITSDNGKEFSCHKDIEKKLWVLRYACDAYASYQRGTNEHTNGMIRVWYPKWTDFSTISDHEINTMKYLLNTKPRKILWYKTPYEVFFNKKLRFFSKIS